ncbi:phage tail tip lysozyme [Caballeronia sp. LZ029]|uniref:phage tail tip lysozyme n=1 Tax=Caballeronia sp. LZ029 TaxID=3038564 RepID=UPI002857E56C|nr:phage tail tip lysozyme [Caballeronia sp. LZ029]MDR5741565.1 phage tail tip lysozyme [Caballeronia sp. LZ029]
MPTIIDSLIVTLGLDPSDYKRGADEANSTGEKLAKTQATAAKAGADATKRASAQQVASMAKTQESAKKLGESFSKVRLELMGMTAGMLGATGLGAFVSKTIGGLEQLGYTARNLGLPVRELDAWHLAVRKLGGADADFDKFAARVARFKADWEQGRADMQDRQFAGTLTNMFGVDAADLKAGNVLKIMRQIAQSQAKVSATDSHTNLSRWLGLDDSMIRLLQQGSTGVQQLYDDEYALSKATEENTQKAAEAAQVWRQFENTLSEIGTTIATDLTPALKEVNTLLDGFSKWIAANPGAAGKIGIGGAVAVSAGGAAATGAAIRALTGGAAAAGGGRAAPIVAAAAGGFTLGSVIRPYYDKYVRKVTGGDRWSLRDYFTGTHRNALKATSGYTQDELDSVKAGGGAKLSADAQRRLTAANDIKESAKSQRAASKAIEDSTKKQQQATVDLVCTLKDLGEFFNSKVSAPDAGGGSVANGDQKGAVDFFMSKGWTKEQAVGIVANLHVESGLDPKARGDSGLAYGVAQWHPDRQAEFKRQFGKDIHGSSLAEQLAFVDYELRHGSPLERRAGRELMNTREEGEAAATVSHRYERPAKDERAKRAAVARQIMAGLRTGVPSPAGGSGQSASRSANGPSMAPMLAAANRANYGAPVINNQSETHIGQITVITDDARNGRKVAADIKDGIRERSAQLGSLQSMG